MDIKKDNLNNKKEIIEHDIRKKEDTCSYSYYILKGLCNSIILVDNFTSECALIDPSTYDKIILKIDELGLTPKMILLTHGHYDHIIHAEKFKEIYSVPIYSSFYELEYLKDPYKNHSTEMINISISMSPDKTILKDKKEESIFLGKLEIRAIRTPGHTKGGASYFIADKNKPILFSGDTLFKGTIGRTDLYGGNFNEILDSIEKKLLVLPKNTEVVPGHGHNTKIVDEEEMILSLRKENLLNKE